MTTITIRDVPEDVRNALAARAAMSGRSLQEHLKRELIVMAQRPSNEEWVATVRRHLADADEGLTRDEIVQYRDADRR